MIDDILVGLEDTVGEPVIPHKLPDVFDRVQLGRFGRQWQDGDVFRNDKTVGHVPSGLIHDEDGVAIVRDAAGYLDQMLVHGMGITPGHDESGRLALAGADRAEDIGRAGALVMGCGWP